MLETQVQYLGNREDLEKGMATLSSITAWEIPWTKESGGLLSMGQERVRQDLVTKQQRFHVSSLKVQLLSIPHVHLPFKILEYNFSSYYADNNATVNVISLPSCLLLNQKLFFWTQSLFRPYTLTYFFVHYILPLLSALTSLLCLNIFIHSFHLYIL